MDKVYIIIVNYKTENLIKRAVVSINEDSVEYKILIVDNEATKNSITTLSALKSDTTELLVSKENLGFAGGVNFGYNYLVSKYDDVEYIFLLNPDALVTDNVIYNLLDVLKSNERYAAVSPHIFNNSTKSDWFAGTIIDYDTCKVINNPRLPKDTNSIIDVFNGCAVLFDADKFEEAGKFDEDTFLYYDEANLAMNMQKLKYQSVYVPTLKVYHDVSSSSGNYSFVKSYYMTRNHMYFFNSNQTVCVFCKYKVPGRNMLSHLKNFRWNALVGSILGIKDFLVNKKGKL